ncbi:MAG: hypothetical protein IPP66_06875 [Anaerolineales bacterium]|nr:hypothetical protein [Anaerolineales bacterium]
MTRWLGGISFGVGWIGVFVPTYYAKGLENYWIRLQPIILFILLAGIATLVMIFVSRKKSPIDLKILRGSVFLFLASMVVLAFMLFSKTGVFSLEDFWYGAGVPILAGQLIVAIIGGLLFLQVEKKWTFKNFDLAIFFLIFVVTAFLWAREPLQKSFLFAGPYPPNQTLYPFADAFAFDVGSQFALIGQKLFFYNTFFFERPLYLSFLLYLHTFFGQNYETLMAAQAGIFAILPALIYLIGRSFNLRSVGFAAALVAMLRGINAIAASNMIDMANQKMILTDFPAAIGVALVVLITCEWLKAPKKNQHYALWLGGALGFTLMLRTNALMLLALLPLYAFFKFAPDWKGWLLHSFLILFAVIAITLPWELRNRSLGGQMYGPIITKFQNVIDQRYRTSTSVPVPIVPTTQASVLQSTHLISILYLGNDPVQDVTVCSSVTCFVPTHFLHNIITSLLILPTSPVMDNLRHVIMANPYWSPSWDGVFPPWTLFFFVLNVFFVILGIALAWDRNGLRGIAPLAIFMFYNLANAFARTSGGRYIVPMDWIVTIYFLLGVFQVIFWVVNSVGTDWKFKSDGTKDTAGNQLTLTKLSKSVVVVVALLGFGALIPLSETLHVKRYQGFSVEHIITENKQNLDAVGLDTLSIDTFRKSPDAMILVGRALYPRSYKKDQGDPFFYPTVKMPFPRTTFTLIGPDGEHGIILPGSTSEYFPHASDVLVIGCKSTKYLDALAVIILDENRSTYIRTPLSNLQCPLQQPVCDNNSNCE